MHLLEWRKHSPVAARSLIVETENLYQKIDEAVLFFDAPWFAGRYPALKTQICAHALDDMITGYMLLTSELLTHFERGGLRLIFVLREIDFTGAGEKQPVYRAGDEALPAAGAGAFRAFAEKIADKLASSRTVSALLIEADALTGDADLSGWLFPYIDALPGVSAGNQKNVRWVKYGAKPGGRFPFLR